jgi:glyoxylate reductase
MSSSEQSYLTLFGAYCNRSAHLCAVRPRRSEAVFAHVPPESPRHRGDPGSNRSRAADLLRACRQLRGADGVLSLLTTTVDDKYLEHAGQQLKVVANYAVGVNNIDLDAARARGIVVTNTPDVLTRTTAELAITLTLSLLRRVTEGDRLIRSRRPWRFALEFMLGESLEGKVFGIVGPGKIGRETARLAEAFGAMPIYAGREDLDTLLGAADIVSLHCPLTDETRHLIDASALATMRPTAVLVNTSRGPVVDERALVNALRDGTIAGAALDVYEFEPEVTEELLAFENVVLSPHLGSATRATREAMGMLAVEALRAVLLDGKLPPNTVS